MTEMNGPKDTRGRGWNSMKLSSLPCRSAASNAYLGLERVGLEGTGASSSSEGREYPGTDYPCSTEEVHSSSHSR